MASICYDNAEYHCAYEWYDEVYNRYKTENFTNIDYFTFITRYIQSSYLIGKYVSSTYLVNTFDNIFLLIYLILY